MIAFWNRQEIYVGVDMNRFNQVLDILAAEKIKYKYRTVNQTARPVQFPQQGSVPTSRSLGTTGIKLDSAIMYYIYVHKKDAEIANQLLHQQ